MLPRHTGWLVAVGGEEVLHCLLDQLVADLAPGVVLVLLALEQCVIYSTSEEDAEALLAKSERVLAVAEATSKVPWPELRNFEDLDERFLWLSGLDAAKSNGWVYWTDDRIRRQVARSMEVATFGTTSLIARRKADSRISHSERILAEATLLRNYYVELDVSTEMFELSAVGDGWRAQGTAAAVSRPGTWRNPPSVIAFVHAALERVAAASMDDVSGWVSAASMGLVRVAGSPEAATSNLAILLRELLARPWLGPLQCGDVGYSFKSDGEDGCQRPTAGCTGPTPSTGGR